MHKIGLIPSPGVSRKHVEAVIPDIRTAESTCE